MIPEHFDPKSPWTLVLFIPSNLRVLGRPDSTPDEVAEVMAAQMYEPGKAIVVPGDHPQMAEIVRGAESQTRLLGGAVEHLGPTTIRYEAHGSLQTRHIRVVLVEPGATPKTPFIDYRSPEQHGLQIVAFDAEEARRLAARLAELEQQRDHEQRQREGAERAAAEASAARDDLALKIERFERDAIIIVPLEDETITETLRRRVRELEGHVERLEQLLVEPSLMQRRRVEMEQANQALVIALRDVLATADSSVLAPGSALRWVAERARAVLKKVAKQWKIADGESASTASDWMTHAASFLAELAHLTGADKHEDGCGCQGCAAVLLLQHAGALGISWKDPGSDVLEDLTGATPGSKEPR